MYFAIAQQNIYIYMKPFNFKIAELHIFKNVLFFFDSSVQYFFEKNFSIFFNIKFIWS